MAGEGIGGRNPQQFRSTIEREPGNIRGMEIDQIPGIADGDIVKLMAEGSDAALGPIIGALSDGPIGTGESFKVGIREVAMVDKITALPNGTYNILTTDGNSYTIQKAPAQGPQSPANAPTPTNQVPTTETETPPANPLKNLSGTSIESRAEKLANTIIDAMEREELERLIAREMDKQGFFRSWWLPNKTREKVEYENKHRVTPEIRTLVENYAVQLVTGQAVNATSNEVFRLMENFGFRVNDQGELVRQTNQHGWERLFQRANPSGGTIAATMAIGGLVSLGLGSFIGGVLGGGVAGGIFGHLRGRREAEESYSSGERWLNEVNSGLESGIEAQIEMACHKVEQLMNNPALQREFFNNRTRSEAAQLLVRYQEGIRRLALIRMSRDIEEDVRRLREEAEERIEYTETEKKKHIAERYAIFCRQIAEGEDIFLRGPRRNHFLQALAQEVGIIAVGPNAPAPRSQIDIEKRQQLEANYIGLLTKRRRDRRNLVIGATSAGFFIGLAPGAIGGTAGALLGPAGLGGSPGGWMMMGVLGTGGAVLGNKYIDRVRRGLELGSTARRIELGKHRAGGIGPYAETTSYPLLPEEPKEKKPKEPRPKRPYMAEAQRREWDARRGRRTLGPEPMMERLDSLENDRDSIQNEIDEEANAAIITGLIKDRDDLMGLLSVFNGIDRGTISLADKQAKFDQLAGELRNRRSQAEFHDDAYDNMAPEEQEKWAQDMATQLWERWILLDALRKRQGQDIAKINQATQQIDQANNEIIESRREPEKIIFEMDLHHHTLKKGFMQEVLDPLNAYDDPEGYRWALRNKYGAHEYALPEEGIMRAQREGEQISKDLLTTADNAVIWLISSKELRTQETNNIIYNEIKDKARNDPDYAGTQLFNMFKYKTLDNVLRAVNQQGGRIVIANQEDVPVMGFNARWDMDKNTEILKERYGGDEGAMLRDWLEDYYLQDEVGARPYEVADGFKVFIRQKQEEFARLFPNRPLVIGAIGHSWEIDAAIVGLIGETFSRAQIDKMGGMIGIMEGAKIVIGTDAEGNKINYLQYRDKRYPLNLEVEEYEYNPNERYIYYGKQVEPPKAIRQRQEGTRENGRQRERGQIEFGTESEALRALISFVYPNEPDMDEGDFLTAFGCRSSQELARVNEASDVIELTDNILNGNQALRPNPEPTIGYPRGRGGGRGGGRHR